MKTRWKFRSLIAARAAAAFSAHDVDGGELRRPVKPAAEHGPLREDGGLAGERGKHRLDDVLGEIPIAADLTPGTE